MAGSVVWLTPPHILRALGEFDLDPCASLDRPWDTAKNHYTVEDDGLAQPWFGRVWCNPPYGPGMDKWLNKLANHSGGGLLWYLPEPKLAHSLTRFGAKPRQSTFSKAESGFALQMDCKPMPPVHQAF